MFRPLIVATVVLLSVTAVATPSRVIVLDLQANGVDAAAIPSLMTRITHEIAAHPAYQVASVQEVREMLSLDKTRQLLGCNEDSACVGELTGKLNADLMLHGSIGLLGKSYVLSLSLVNGKETASAKRASETFETMDAVEKGAAAVLAQVFGWRGAMAERAKFKLPKGKKLSFAVFDLSATGVSEDTAKNLTQILSTEVKSIEGTTVVSRDDILKRLEFGKFKEAQLGCAEDTACMTELAGALGVDKMIIGSVGKLADSFIINVRLFDMRTSLVDNRLTESFRGEEDQLIRATRHATRQLLGIEENGVGRLAVTASHPGATVFVDEERKAQLPVPPLDNLAPGRHGVRLAKDGFFDWQGDFYVGPGETTAAWATLKERPAKWYQKWWVWTAAGVVVAGTAGGILYATRPPPTTGSGVVTLP